MAFKGLIWSLVLRRQLHVISRSSCNIKPASPTPSNLKQYNISLYDRDIPNLYIPMVLFYPNYNIDRIRRPIPSNASDLLKKSLSQTLSKYYPFAGRLSFSGSYVDCNDDGVHFVDAEIGCNLSEVLERAPVKEEEDGLGHLFPPCTIWNLYSGIIMHVQLNHFACGGIAVAVSLSHRVGDVLTFCTFLKYWATLSLHSGDHQKLLHLCPHMLSELPPPSHDVNSFNTSTYGDKNWTTKELVFANTRLAELKVAVNNEDKVDGVVEDQKYTRNELLTALLYRCLLAAAAKTNTVAHDESVLVRVVNVRPMTDPPLPETSVGNFIILTTIIASTEIDTKYRTLVSRMRKERRRLNGIKSLAGHETGKKLVEFQKINYRFYLITSMCNFPLYDVTDFGWGKPIKAMVVDNPKADYVTLMDTANDGIRAIVSLEEQDMQNFLGQKELLTYASF